jgi:hypothetical protein
MPPPRVRRHHHLRGCLAAEERPLRTQQQLAAQPSLHGRAAPHHTPTLAAPARAPAPAQHAFACLASQPRAPTRGREKSSARMAVSSFSGCSPKSDSTWASGTCSRVRPRSGSRPAASELVKDTPSSDSSCSRQTSTSSNLMIAVHDPRQTGRQALLNSRANCHAFLLSQQLLRQPQGD